MTRKIIRILEIVFVLFISIFALDVVGEENWIVALLIHLIPTYILIVLTWISWKKEILGGILWVLTAVIIKFTTGIGWIITLPMVIIGGLSLWVGVKNKRNPSPKN